MVSQRRWSMSTSSRQHAMRDAVKRVNNEPEGDQDKSNGNHQEFGGLSQELSDMVIDCLCDDLPTLQACALTCQAWLPRTRHHIHRRVTIRIDIDDPDEDFEPMSPEPDHDCPSSEVAQFVEELRIMALPPPWEPDSYTAPLDPPTEALRDNCSKLWSSLERYTHLRRLTLIAFEWRYSPSEEMKFMAIFLNITHLDLAQSNFRSLGHFLSLLAAFPNMTVLSLTRIHWPRTEGPLDAPLRPGAPHDTPPRFLFPTRSSSPTLHKLRSLSFVGDGCDPYIVSAIAGWLSQNAHQLRNDIEFVWSCIWCPGLINLPSVLIALGRSVQHVELHIAGRQEFMEATRGVSFMRENHCLHSILLFVSCSPPLNDSLYMDDPIDPLLSELDSPDLSRIEFACCYQPNLPWTTNSSTFTANHVDEILSRPTFANLSSLVFSFSYKFEQHKDEINRIMGTCFTRAASRGILRLEFGWTFSHL